MAHQVEEAALLVRALELFLPDVEDVLLAPDPVADRRDRAEAEVDPVVVDPRGGQLDQLAVGRLVAVRQIGVHQVAVVDEAVLPQKLHRVLARIARRRPRAARPDAEHALEDVQALHEQGLLLLTASQEERLLVQVAVVADLVTAAQRLARHIRIALDDPARDEEAHLDVVALEDAQDARHAGLGAVGAHAHMQRALGECGIAMDPRALAVHVEREGHRAARAVLPLDRSVHGRLLDFYSRASAGGAPAPRRPAAANCAERCDYAPATSLSISVYTRTPSRRFSSEMRSSLPWIRCSSSSSMTKGLKP